MRVEKESKITKESHKHKSWRKGNCHVLFGEPRSRPNILYEGDISLAETFLNERFRFQKHDRLLSVYFSRINSNLLGVLLKFNKFQRF